jgi:hypothetical protein
LETESKQKTEAGAYAGGRKGGGKARREQQTGTMTKKGKRRDKLESDGQQMMCAGKRHSSFERAQQFSSVCDDDDSGNGSMLSAECMAGKSDSNFVILPDMADAETLVSPHHLLAPVLLSQNATGVILSAIFPLYYAAAECERK